MNHEVVSVDLSDTKPFQDGKRAFGIQDVLVYVACSASYAADGIVSRAKAYANLSAEALELCL